MRRYILSYVRQIVTWHSITVAIICYIIMTYYRRHYTCPKCARDIIVYRRQDGTDYEVRFSTKNQRVDPFQFDFLLRDFDKCKTEPSPMMVICVMSPVQNLAQRKIIRTTFGQESVLRAYEAALVFFIGQSDDAKITEDIAVESRTFGDTVQEGYKDKRKHDSLKIVTILKWLHKHCNNVKFVTIIEDNVFINIRTITKWYKEDLAMIYHNTPFIMTCLVRPRSKPKRDPSNQDFVSQDEFWFEEFPPHCDGSAMITNIETVTALHEASFYSEYIWTHGFYLSTLLGQRIGMMLINSTKQTHRLRQTEHFPLVAPKIKSYMFLFPLPSKNIEAMWHMSEKIYKTNAT